MAIADRALKIAIIAGEHNRVAEAIGKAEKLPAN
jgi:hypothetical protein